MNKRTSEKNIKATYGINKKLNLAFFVIVFVSIVAIGTFVYLQMSHALREKLIMTSEEFMKESARHIDAYFEGYKKLVVQASLHDAIINYKSGDEEELYKIIDSMISGESDIMAAYFATPNKKIYLRPLTSIADDFDPTVRPWYTKAIEANGFAWSDPYIDNATKQTTITAAIPIKRHNIVVGVLGIDLDLNKLAAKINEIVVADHGYPVLVTADGKILSHRDPEQIGNTMPVEELYQLIISRNEDTIDYQYKGETKFAVSKNIDKLNLTIMATLEENEYTADVNNLMIKNSRSRPNCFDTCASV